MAGVFNSLFLSLLFNRSLSSSQTGNRNTIRRAGNIVQTDGIEELNGLRITAVFTADTQMQIRIGCAAFNGSTANQFANAVNIDGSKRISNINAFGSVFVKNSTGIVTAHTQSGLGQVVGTETEERGRLGNFFSHQCSSRQFNHRADQVVNLLAFFSEDFFGGRIDNGFNDIQFFLGTD